MNQEERSLLESFLGQLVQARASVKDPEAESLIAQAVARQADAAYLLVQRSLLLEQGLAQANGRIAELEKSLQSQSAPSGFLGATSDWGWHAKPAASASVTSVSGQPIRQISQSQPGQYAPAASPPMQATPSQGPSFLGQMATTAAGVAAGAFLFRGMESLFSHPANAASIPVPPSPSHAAGDLQPLQDSASRYTSQDVAEADTSDDDGDEDYGQDNDNDQSA